MHCPVLSCSICRSQCHLEEADAKLGSCHHCGAQKWNIVGDSETGE